MDITCNHKINDHHTSPFHYHNQCELYLFLRGDVDFYTEKEAFKLQPGTLLPIRPNHWHKAQTVKNQPYERFYLHFPLEEARKLSTTKTDLTTCFHTQELPMIYLNQEKREEFLFLGKTLQKILLQNSYGSDVLIRAILSQLLVIANNPTPSLLPKNLVQLPPLIAEMLLFIDQNLNSDLSIAAFAKHFFMNGAYLSRYFKKIMGLTLQEYIIDKRIEFAKELLAYGLTLEEVVQRTGFGNYYHFIRAFKARVGISPGAFKKITPRISPL